MSITLPNLEHSFISPIPVPILDPDSGFRILDFSVFYTPSGMEEAVVQKVSF